MVIPYIRCLRCGAHIRKKGKRGVPPKYCDQCSIKRHRERSIKSMKLKKRKLDSYVNMIKKDFPSPQIDTRGKPYIDETHANWDVILTPHGLIEMLGSISEWELDKRIARLRKQVEAETLKKSN